MKKQLSAVIILLSLCLIADGRSFSHLTVENGLQNNTVSAICQDSLGRIWLATKGGVSRYNGYSVDSFKFSSDDDRTIQSNFVNKIYLDDWNRIWACTADGLAEFIPETGRFRRVNIEGTRSVELIYGLDADHYLLGTRNCSFIYERSSGKATEFTLNGKSFVHYCAVWNGDTLIVSTPDSKLVNLTFSPESGLSVCGKRIPMPSRPAAIIPDRNGGFWIGTQNKGIIHYDPKSRQTKVIDLSELPSKKIEDLEIDNNGRLWIGTKKGLCIYDPEDGSEERVVSDPEDENTIADDAIRCIFRDTSGNMWIGSSYGGVCCHLSKSSPFNVLSTHARLGGLSCNIIRAIHVDPDSTIWLGLRYNGLDRYDRKSRKLTNYRLDNYYILCFYQPEDHDLLYAGSYENGIIEVNRRKGTLRQISRPTDINAMIPAKNGLIWVANLSGLHLFNPETGTMKTVVREDQGIRMRALTLLTDSDGHLWVGSKESLREYEVSDSNTLTEITPDAIKNIVRVQFLHEMPDETIWIGTSDGLLSYSDGVLNRCAAQTDLRNCNIEGISSDSLGRLWVITDNGLCRYDVEDATSRFYYTDDGLPGNQYNNSAIFRDNDGTIYVGGAKGLSFFKPEDIDADGITVPPYISGIWVNNRRVEPGDGTGILSREISITDAITLKHSQRSILIRFACPDYASWGHRHFKYILEGFDRDWTVSDGREANYTNLPKGRYTFRLKSANSDGVWGNDEAVLKIRVRPAWFRTLGFELLCLLVIVALIGYLIHLAIVRVKKRNIAEMDQLKLRYEADIRQARLHSYIKKDSILNAQDEFFLSSVLKHIEDGLSNPEYGIQELASDMCMSRSNLHLKVKAICDMSPIDLLKKVRIEKACELLRRGDVPLKDVASRTGFSSLSYFSTAFKKAMGQTPGRYFSKNP